MRALGLPYDPIERAGESWEQHFGPAAAMRAATSVFRVQQILLARFDEALRPHELEAVAFSATGEELAERTRSSTFLDPRPR